MGLKGLHAFGREGSYHQVSSVSSHLQLAGVNIVFVDFSCVLFFLLQQGRLPTAAPPAQQHFSDQELNNLSIAERLFAHSIAHEYSDQYAAFQETVRGFVDLTVAHFHRLCVAAGQPHVCLVIDGQARLPAKRSTPHARKRRQRNAFRVACRIYARQNHQYIFGRYFSFVKQVKRWVSFTHAINGPIINYLQSGDSPTVPYVQRVQHTAPADPRLFFQQAPFEADPELVYLCDNLAASDNGVILSRDGDLFAYGGALDVPVDECMTSRKCSWCIRRGIDHFANYFQRPTHNPVRDRTRVVGQDAGQDVIQTIRLVHCKGPGACARVLYRDGNAASNPAIITKCMLQHRQRHACFIRPSRQLHD